ncbi:MAG: hypothetical protein R3Y64_10315 [Peptostreptococcaceae bacterium]
MEKTKGHSSRTKNKLIIMAIESLPEEDKYNTFKVCEKVCFLMEDRYKDKKLEYHSQRMGLDTSRKVLMAIEDYFYKYYKNN